MIRRDLSPAIGLLLLIALPAFAEEAPADPKPAAEEAASGKTVEEKKAARIAFLEAEIAKKFEEIELNRALLEVGTNAGGELDPSLRDALERRGAEFTFAGKVSRTADGVLEFTELLKGKKPSDFATYVPPEQVGTWVIGRVRHSNIGHAEGSHRFCHQVLPDGTLLATELKGWQWSEEMMEPEEWEEMKKESKEVNKPPLKLADLARFFAVKK